MGEPLENDRYTYRVSWSEKNQEYVGLCTEFPKLRCRSVSQFYALDGIRRMVADAVYVSITSGESVPVPLSLREFSGRFVVRIPPEVHRNLAIEAAEAGISLNRLVSSRLAR
jgi:hypothetical protein